MDSIGAALRRARDQRGLTLDDVAALTKINRKHLESIESGDRSAIPGGFFYKSFVRQYAAALSTGDSDLVDEIEELLAAEQPPPPPVARDEEAIKVMSAMPMQERASWNPSAASYAIILVIALIGCSGLYAWWHRTQQAQASADAKPRPPVLVQRTEAPMMDTKKPEAQKPEAQKPETKQAAAQPSEVQRETPTPPSEPAAVAANPDDKISLEVTANEDAWFWLGADGKTLFSGVLQAGQTKTFTAKENVRMKIGNAGGLDIKFNGKPTGPIGPKAQVRTVVFTPDKFEIQMPKPPEE
jgi:cytoskeleton protein RodZ